MEKKKRQPDWKERKEGKKAGLVNNDKKTSRHVGKPETVKSERGRDKKKSTSKRNVLSSPESKKTKTKLEKFRICL